jgi:dihydrofolate reductase
MPKDRKVILYIAMSLDGYIAGPGDNLDFLSLVEKGGEDYGYHEFISTVDTVILGRKTYDKILSFGIPFPHNDKQTYVITRNKRPGQENLAFYSGNLNSLIETIQTKPGKHIFIDGGAELANELMKEDLIDEYILSVIPIFLGKGISLFKDGRPEHKLILIKSSNFEKGLVQLHYARSPASS